MKKSIWKGAFIVGLVIVVFFYFGGSIDAPSQTSSGDVAIALGLSATTNESGSSVQVDDDNPDIQEVVLNDEDLGNDSISNLSVTMDMVRKDGFVDENNVGVALEIACTPVDVKSPIDGSGTTFYPIVYDSADEEYDMNLAGNTVTNSQDGVITLVPQGDTVSEDLAFRVEGHLDMKDKLTKDEGDEEEIAGCKVTNEGRTLKTISIKFRE